MVKRLKKDSSPLLIKVVIGLVLLSFILLIFYALLRPRVVPKVDVNNAPLPDVKDIPVPKVDNPSVDPYAGMWICGNGIADPREDCLSCPQDLPVECACTTSNYGSKTASLGENFSVCFNQKVSVDDIEFLLSDYTKTRVDVSFPSGKEEVLRPEEGTVIDVWYWDGADLNSYKLSVLKNVHHGVWLNLDYRELNAEEDFSVLNSQKIKIGDFLFSSSFLENSSEETVEVSISYFGAEETKILNLNENITLGDTVLAFNGTIDGAMCFSFVGDSND
ncbi:hypothetical protein K8R43_04890 [archaeon]|nr:hypothetical protein [archaeon]